MTTGIDRPTDQSHPNTFKLLLIFGYYLPTYCMRTFPLLLLIYKESLYVFFPDDSTRTGNAFEQEYYRTRGRRRVEEAACSGRPVRDPSTDS